MIPFNYIFKTLVIIYSSHYSRQTKIKSQKKKRNIDFLRIMGTKQIFGTLFSSRKRAIPCVYVINAQVK